MFNLLAVNSSQGDQQFNSMVSDVLTIVNNYVVRGALIIGCLIIAVCVIINAIKFSKAEDGEPKTKAKKNLIGCIIGLVAMFAAIWLLPMFINFLITIMQPTEIDPNLYFNPNLYI